MTEQANLPDSQRLDELFELAQMACDQGVSSEDFEREFVILVEFIQAHPACSSEVERRFVAHVRGRTPYWELLAFCMHALRIRAVELAVREVLESEPHPTRSVSLQHVLDAFDDHWVDADMYRYFRRANEPNM